MTEKNPLFSYFGRNVNGGRLLVTGPFSHDDLGLKRYHSKVGAVELLLNHLLDDSNEYVVVDMTAGADSFASGMFTKFDLTFLVVEPTVKSLGVYKQYKEYARNYDVKIRVIGNKIEADEDVAFLRGQVGDDLLACFGRSRYVRAMEKGMYLSFLQLETENQQVLETMKMAVDACEKDWQKMYRQTVDFHLKNALSWANAAVGEGLTQQIDPDYSLVAHIQQRQPVLVS
jgi:CO dehydrogenase maturation factor